MWGDDPLTEDLPWNHEAGMRRHEGEETPLHDDVLIRRAVAERLYIDGERATAPYCTYHLVNAIVAIAGTVLFHARSEYCTLQRVAL